jgi:hypothetical protein
MSVSQGYKGKFMVGANTVAQVTSVEYGGITHDLSEYQLLADEFKKFEHGQSDGGKITLNVLLDCADTNGQTVLRTASVNKTKLSVANSNAPKIYVDATNYFELSTSPVAEALIENSHSIGAVDPKTNLVASQFIMQVSNGYLMLHA